jgi:hypothetical protein
MMTDRISLQKGSVLAVYVAVPATPAAVPHVAVLATHFAALSDHVYCPGPHCGPGCPSCRAGHLNTTSPIQLLLLNLGPQGLHSSLELWGNPVEADQRRPFSTLGDWTECTVVSTCPSRSTIHVCVIICKYCISLQYYTRSRTKGPYMHPPKRPSKSNTSFL